MSLNCLACQTLQRTDSEKENGDQIYRKGKMWCINIDRSWSGNLTPPTPAYEQMRNGSIVVATKSRKINNHRRLHSTGAVFEDSETPRLVRSAGMRRDWSFEDLGQRNIDMQMRKGGRFS